MSDRTVLITGPLLEKEGGVANFFDIFLKRTRTRYRYFIVGRRTDNESFFRGVCRLAGDYLKFIVHAAKPSVKLVHINPSLTKRSVMRDGVFVVLARLMQKPTLVSFHGWNTTFETEQDLNGLSWYMRQLCKADAFTVQGKNFVCTLERWGVRKPIYLEPTFVDDNEMAMVNQDLIHDRCMKPGELLNLLFLARLEKDKGLYESIEAFRLLRNKFPDLTLTIAGNGPEEQKARQYAQENNIDQIEFTGFITGDRKRNVWRDSDIYLFPTYYGEGTPTSVIEAMSFGLPVITRPVGGLADFFEGDKMGALTDSIDVKEIARLIEMFVEDSKRRHEVGLFNFQYVRENFAASKAVERFDAIYDHLLASSVLLAV